ncbi:MAG: TIGR03905 family TSCPD domain-containing protein [Anaerovoracaceae bacterium]
MVYRYKTKGTCSVCIDVEMEGNTLKNAVFHGGCNGNLQGISALVSGLTYEEIRDKLSGIKCGFKSTSCPDQLVRALEEAMKNAESQSAE